MSVLLGLLLLGVLDRRLPTDADIAARIETVIRQELNPDHVTVTVKRHSRFTSTLDRVEIDIAGFTADRLPFTMAGAEAPVLVAGPAPAGKDAEDDREVRIVELVLRCEHFTVQRLPVRALELRMQQVAIPWSAIEQQQFAIRSAALAEGHLLLEEADLARFLRTLPLPLTEPQLTILPTGCTVQGGWRAVLNTPVEVTGTLRARQRAVLFVDEPRLRVSVVRVPVMVSNRLLKDLDPIVDLNAALGLPVPLVIQRIEHQQHRLRVEARLLFPTRNEAP